MEARKTRSQKKGCRGSNIICQYFNWAFSTVALSNHFIPSFGFTCLNLVVTVADTFIEMAGVAVFADWGCIMHDADRRGREDLDRKRESEANFPRDL